MRQRQPEFGLVAQEIASLVGELQAAAAGSLDTAHESAAMARARRSMRTSAEQVLDLRVQAQIAAFLVGPPDRHKRIDLVGTVEYESLSRLRPALPFPIHQRMPTWHPKWKDLKVSLPLRLNDSVAGLVAELSTRGIAGTAVRMGQGDEQRSILFHTESMSINQETRVVFAERLRKASTIGDAVDRAELDVAIHQPVSFAVLEVWVHHLIARTTESSAVLIGWYGTASRLGRWPGRGFGDSHGGWISSRRAGQNRSPF